MNIQQVLQQRHAVTGTLRAVTTPTQLILDLEVVPHFRFRNVAVDLSGLLTREINHADYLLAVQELQDFVGASIQLSPSLAQGVCLQVLQPGKAPLDLSEWLVRQRFAIPAIL